MSRKEGRITQRDIARLAGVSQSAVSLILNGGADDVRIAPETRERVLDIIRNSGYIPDPLARRLQRKGNQLLGVFTYEPVFPNAQADFYTPFLLGIEEEAERQGYDLLLFTSTPVENGRRKLFREESRLRLADGCVVLGREQDRDELARLAADGFPFVAIGRRDDTSGTIPYVGADYVSVTRALVRRAFDLGHRRLAYVGLGAGAESLTDRWNGFHSAATELGLATFRIVPGTESGRTLLDDLSASGITAAFCEDFNDAVRLEEEARRQGAGIPQDMSLVAMSNPVSPSRSGPVFSGLEIPREEMGRHAVRTLCALIEKKAANSQTMLDPILIDGETLGKTKE